MSGLLAAVSGLPLLILIAVSQASLEIGNPWSSGGPALTFSYCPTPDCPLSCPQTDPLLAGQAQIAS